MGQIMRYGQIRKYDVANGPGIRTSLFITGCPICCKGCFNKAYQDYSAGEVWTKKQEDLIIEYLLLDHVSGLSILGGEPLAQKDDDLLQLLIRVKKQAKKDIWLWTGYIYEHMNSYQKNILRYIDILVDGPFILEKKDLNLRFKGSSNQRIIDMKKTVSCSDIVLWN